MASLLNKVRRTGFLILIGLVAIIYLGFAFLFFQQSPNQNKIADQIIQLQTVINKPLASIEKLSADYKHATNALAIVSSDEILKKIISAAEESGINIEPGAGKFTFPSASVPKLLKVGTHSYQITSFTGIRVQGEYTKVMDFVNRLDSGNVLPTLVLKRVTIEDVALPEVDTGVDTTVDEMPPAIDKDSPNYKEYQIVRDALEAMVKENKLVSLPNPSFPHFRGKATNDMRIFPDFSSGWEGSPQAKSLDPEGRSYSIGVKLRTDGVDSWVEGDKLYRQGVALIAEGEQLIEQGDRLWAEGDKLWTQGYDLWKQGNAIAPEMQESVDLKVQSNALMVEAHKLMAEGDKRREQGKNYKTSGNDLKVAGAALWDEGDKLWAESSIVWQEGDKVGYLLYQHDNKADAAKINLVNYISTMTTTYYYTIDGWTLRQFDGPETETAQEFTYYEEPTVPVPGEPEVQEPVIPEVQAILNIDLYNLPPATPSKTK